MVRLRLFMSGEVELAYWKSGTPAIVRLARLNIEVIAYIEIDKFL
jgi:hypothetical protein